MYKARAGNSRKLVGADDQEDLRYRVPECKAYKIIIEGFSKCKRFSFSPCHLSLCYSDDAFTTRLTFQTKLGVSSVFMRMIVKVYDTFLALLFNA